MNDYDFLKKILNKGILIKLFYYDENDIKKFCFLYKGEWLNLLKIQEPVNREDVINISINEPFNFENVRLDILEYVSFPKGLLLQDIIDPSSTFKKLGDDFLKKNKDYLKEITKEIMQIKLHYKENLERHLENLKNSEGKNFEDLLILRFYPQKTFENYKNIEDIKQDIQKKYFIIGEQVEFFPNESSNPIPALVKLGTSSSNFEVTDESYLNALKRQWFRLIQDEKEKLYNKLENIKDFALSENELEEYHEELNLFKKEIDSISLENFKDFKTVKEVVSYWPESLQPKPEFVYEN